MLFFGLDSPGGTPKIYLRTLLYSSSTRGQILQGVFLKVRNPAGEHGFDFWAHGEKGQLTRGSGLYVGQAGIACDHHFLLRDHSEEPCQFIAGNYYIEVFVAIVGRRPTKLMDFTLELPDQIVEQMVWRDAGVFFDWHMDADRYVARLEERPSA
jgi:hypothetical protein